MSVPEAHVVSPVCHMNGLPLALSNEDQGATVMGAC
jgi:hypothetical protein